MAVNFQKTKEMVIGPPSLVSNFFYQSRALLVALSKSPSLNFWDFIWTPTFLGGPMSRLCYLKPPSDSILSQALKACGCPLCTASTFLCGSNPTNLRIRGPSLASFTHELSERSDRSHTKTSY